MQTTPEELIHLSLESLQMVGYSSEKMDWEGLFQIQAGNTAAAETTDCATVLKLDKTSCLVEIAKTSLILGTLLTTLQLRNLLATEYG